MTIVRKLVMAGVTMLAGYALKRLMGRVQAQADRMAEKVRQQNEAGRDVRDVKRLKQDPETGVYYAED